MKHNPRTCNAFHSACENVRDTDDIGWAATLTLTNIDDLADEYVRDGLSECTCQTITIAEVAAAYRAWARGDMSRAEAATLGQQYGRQEGLTSVQVLGRVSDENARRIS